ncbi:MAG: TlyA family RNA methyltransferase [Leptospiraceae bacterium]|nr:TlyA family RNA methyltransferase [Leptospiraceae bacterium]
MGETLLQYLLTTGYAEKQARGLILSGQVLINESIETRAGQSIRPTDTIRIKESRQYVSRAAWKLLGALDHQSFDWFEPHRHVCLDLGASHGGFSQVLIERGAHQIYAIDVAQGIFDYQLRQDPRIHLLEKHNVRHMKLDWFGPEFLQQLQLAPCLCIVCDIAFMSLRTVVQSILNLHREIRTGLRLQIPAEPSKQPGNPGDEASGFQNRIQFDFRLDLVLLLKPQFENSAATNNGIIDDAAITADILNSFINWVTEQGFVCLARQPAAIKGRGGNQEYVIGLRLDDRLC